jgi:DNA-binding transcriptional regulator GbsR (MarR family)
MKLTPAMQTFILHWGDMGSKWGLNRSVSQIYALLHISPAPLTAEELATTLNLARSNISTGLKELLTWRLIRTTRQLGDRRDYYTSLGDMYDLIETVIAIRREREFEPTLLMLRDIQSAAETDDTPPEVRTRMAETYEAMQALDGWYEDIAALPRAAQLNMLKVGAKIGSLLGDATGKSKKKKKNSASAA